MQRSTSTSPLVHCHPRQSGPALPAPNTDGEQGPHPTFTLGSLPQDPGVLRALFPAQLPLPKRGFHVLKLHVFSPSSKGVFLQPISTFPHLPQSLRSRVCLPGPVTISRLGLLKSIGNHCQCNLFQGWPVHCTPCSNGLSDPH